MSSTAVYIVQVGFALSAWSAPAAEPGVIERTVLRDQLRSMWLGQVIANHTGRITEGQRDRPPFLTDEDWGPDRPEPNDGQPNRVIDFVLDQDPWLADDDTDIEYVYLHLLSQHGTSTLTGDQIAAGWREHVNGFVWGANATARNLMDRGVTPPETGIPVANNRWLRISNQLTTEFFGAMSPGMPRKALEMADLPIRTSVSGHAAHASQFHVLLYSLGAARDPGPVSPSELIDLVSRARLFIPDSSKSADVIDFVLADYLANPDVDDWERTRDGLHVRYRRDSLLYGYRYRGWFESTVNLGAGVMALLYGEGDYLRTVQIGTLSGWDSDNGTATMGGLLGLMLGYDELLNQLPPRPYSDRFDVFRTRTNLPDHLPDDTIAQDTFTLMSERMLQIVETAIRENGGFASDDCERYLLPPFPDELITPMTIRAERSANNRSRSTGRSIDVTSTVTPDPPMHGGTANLSVVVNGIEDDDTGYDPWPDEAARAYFSTESAPANEVVIEVQYGEPVMIEAVRLVEGDHFNSAELDGGWFQPLAVEVFAEGVWMDVAVTPATQLDNERPFQIIDLDLAVPRTASGLRVHFATGGTDAFLALAEIDALAPSRQLSAPTFDINGDGSVDALDELSWTSAPFDLSGDGVVDSVDETLIAYAAGWPSSLCPSCACERDGMSGVGFTDLLAYLDDWLVNAPAADLTADGLVEIVDLLAFLECWYPAASGGECS